jgi:uncharacterized protein (TIGR02246 family)
MVAAANARDIERWLSFVVPDAKMMPPGAPPVEGKDAIRKLVSEMMRAPEFVVAHHVRSVEVSRGGDLAYILYSYELTTQGPSRQTVTGKGKDLSIYRKESDGSWKLVIDIWSENQPPPGRS